MSKRTGSRRIFQVIAAILAAEVLLYIGLTAILQYWSGYTFSQNFFRYFAGMPLFELTILFLGASLFTLIVKDLNSISNGFFLITMIVSVIASVKSIQYMVSASGKLLTLAEHCAALLLLVGIVLLCLYAISFRNLGKAAYLFLFLGALAGLVLQVMQHLTNGGTDELWRHLPSLLIVTGAYLMTAVYGIRYR